MQTERVVKMLGGEELLGAKIHSASEHDGAHRLACVVAQAKTTFDNEEKAREWLLRPNRALGQVTPLSLLDTDEGARQVEAVLGRIEHGVWS